MLPTVFVFYWMITLSVKPQVEATAYPPSFFSFSLTLKGYREVFTKYPFLLYTWNSLVVAAGCTALGLAVGLPGRLLDRPLAAAAPRADRPGGAHHPGHLVPHPLVHLLPAPAAGRHARGAHPDAPHRGPADHHLGHDRLLRGRAAGPGGRRPDRRLLLLRRVLARGAAPGPPGRRRDGDPVVRLLVEQLPVLGDPGRPSDADPARSPSST